MYTLDSFQLDAELAKGRSCVLYSARWLAQNGMPVVLKIYNQDGMSEDKRRAVRREAIIADHLYRSRVPNMCQTYAAFEEGARFVIIMAVCSRGSLLKCLLEVGVAMKERQACKAVAVPMLITLAHMHRLDVAHRDVKLDNIFVRSDNRVVLGDFGLTIHQQKERSIVAVGTIDYMAPEILLLPKSSDFVSGSVDPRRVTPTTQAVDVWALGVTVYELVCGCSPWRSNNKEHIREDILAGRIKPMPSKVTSGFRDFIAHILVADPSRRPSAEQVLRHPWVQSNAGEVRLSFPAAVAAEGPTWRAGEPNSLWAAAPAAKAAVARTPSERAPVPAGGLKPVSATARPEEPDAARPATPRTLRALPGSLKAVIGGGAQDKAPDLVAQQAETSPIASARLPDVPATQHTPKSIISGGLTGRRSSFVEMTPCKQPGGTSSAKTSPAEQDASGEDCKKAGREACVTPSRPLFRVHCRPATPASSPEPSWVDTQLRKLLPAVSAWSWGSFNARKTADPEFSAAANADGAASTAPAAQKARAARKLQLDGVAPPPSGAPRRPPLPPTARAKQGAGQAPLLGGGGQSGRAATCEGPVGVVQHVSPARKGRSRPFSSLLSQLARIRLSHVPEPPEPFERASTLLTAPHPHCADTGVRGCVDAGAHAYSPAKRLDKTLERSIAKGGIDSSDEPESARIGSMLY